MSLGYPQDITDFNAARNSGDLVWYGDIDNSAFRVIVPRIDESTGSLQVYDMRDPSTPKLLHKEDVTLYFGAPFGPDVSNVMEWQEKALEVVDRLLTSEQQS